LKRTGKNSQGFPAAEHSDESTGGPGISCRYSKTLPRSKRLKNPVVSTICVNFIFGLQDTNVKHI
jgi:hypothetical protein